MNNDTIIPGAIGYGPRPNNPSTKRRLLRELAERCPCDACVADSPGRRERIMEARAALKREAKRALRGAGQ